MSEFVTATVQVSHNTLLAAAPTDFGPFTSLWIDGPEEWLVNGGDERVILRTGGWGPTTVTVVTHDETLDVVSDETRAAWEDIGEASFSSSSSQVFIDQDAMRPNLAFTGPGNYRVRVLARGRTDYWDAVPPKAKQPWVQLELHVWAETHPGPVQLHQYKDRTTGSIVRPDEAT